MVDVSHILKISNHLFSPAGLPVLATLGDDEYVKEKVVR